MSYRWSKLKLLVLTMAFVIITYGAFYAALAINNNLELQTLVKSWGVIGMLTVSFLSSLNAVLPIPPATFAPIFLSAGFSYWIVIVSFAVGASAADSAGYVLGWLGRGYAATHHPKVTRRIDNLFVTHQAWILPCAYLYMAFAPLPNEYIMIPLALAGYRYQHLIAPLLLGNIFYFTWTVYGYSSFFDWWF